ncbi:MAG: GldM family protein [Bacteroidia bacterium]
MKKIFLVLILMLLKAITLIAQDPTSINKIKVSKAKPFVAVELAKMNVLYVGVDNPVYIAVSGINTFYVSMARGNIIENGNSYLIKETTQGIDTLFVYDTKNNLIDKKYFRVKRVPNPVACVGSSVCKSGSISKNVLLVQMGLIPYLNDFDFEIFFKITHFQMTILNTPNGNISLENTNNLFTAEMKKAIELLSIGSLITFENIDAVGPDKQVRRLDPLYIVLK